MYKSMLHSLVKVLKPGCAAHKTGAMRMRKIIKRISLTAAALLLCCFVSISLLQAEELESGLQTESSSALKETEINSTENQSEENSCSDDSDETSGTEEEISETETLEESKTEIPETESRENKIPDETAPEKNSTDLQEKNISESDISNAAESEIKIQEDQKTEETDTAEEITETEEMESANAPGYVETASYAFAESILYDIIDNYYSGGNEQNTSMLADEIHTIWQSDAYVYNTFGENSPTALRIFRLDSSSGQYAYCIDPDKDYPSEVVSVSNATSVLMKAIILLSPGGKYYESGVDGISLGKHYTAGGISAMAEGYYTMGYCLQPNRLIMDYIYSHFLLAFVYHKWGSYGSYEAFDEERTSEGAGYYDALQGRKITRALYNQLAADVSMIQTVLADTTSDLYQNAKLCVLSIGSSSVSTCQKAAWITSQEDPPAIEMKTTAQNASTGLKLIYPGKTIKIKDTVEMKNLVKGQTYILEGTLYNAESGKFLYDGDGNKITASLTFTCTSSDCSKAMSFSFTNTGLAGTTVVVGERLYTYKDEEKNLILTHKDMSDTDQMVYAPLISTSAFDSTDGDKIITDKQASVTDTVSMSNLVPGYTYRLYGRLYNKKTGKAIKIPISESETAYIEKEKILTTKKTAGSYNMKFAFETYQLNWEDLVVYEYLYVQDPEDETVEYLVAAEKDLENEEQCLAVRHPEDPPDTGLRENLNGLELLALGLCIAGLILMTLFRKQN